MEYICLYTIVHPITRIKDFSCDPDFADYKSKQGYLVYADLIQRPKYFFKEGVIYG